MTEVRVLYSDLDGTMLGRGGSFFADWDGAPTLEPAEALLEVQRAGVTLVLVSGRTRHQLVEAARILGADGFVGELGAVLGWDGGRRVEVLRGAMPTHLTGTPVEAMQAGGVAELLFDAWPDRLEYHSPWHEGHDADLMLRGNVPLDEVHRLLEAHGWGWLRLRDNGVLPARAGSGFGDRPVHVYHLMPDGLSKGLGVAADLSRRGVPAEHAVAVGDSLSDLEMAAVVGRMFLVANGAASPATAERAAALPTVSVTRRPVGGGWAEAVAAVLHGSAVS